MSLFYITKARALEMGLTHEGTLFGVPAWFAGSGDANDPQGVIGAVPKCPLLEVWTLFADSLFEAASCFMSADRELVAPIHIKGPIK